jgi:hypothetical protein
MADKYASASKYVVAANFHVYVAQGDGKPEKRVAFAKGQVLEASDIPAGQTGEDWLAKGLVTAA